MNPRTLLAVALTAVSANAGTGYTFVDLGTLGGNDSGALGINDQGQIVGWSTIPGCSTASGADCRRAFLWDNGVMTDLGFLPGDEGSVANSINNSGVIVGNSERDVIAGSGTYRAVIWNSVGPPTPLVNFGVGTSYAKDINSSGTVVGYVSHATTLRDTAVTWQNNVITDIGASEPHEYSRGTGLSDNGQVASMAWNLFSPGDSMHFDGTWTQIGGFGQFENSEAHDLNDSGRIVGTQAFPNGNWHAAMWQAGQNGATDLGVLPGHSLGYLLDVNEAGAAVGYSLYEAGPVYTRAIYSDGVTLTDVNTLLPAGTNAILWDAMEINEDGDIVGAAEINGQFRAYLLKKTPTDHSYCATAVNSTGSAAVLSVNGSTSVSANNFELVAQPVPVTPALFFYGPNQVSLPFGDGVLCVGGSITRLNPGVISVGNRATRVVDLIGEGISPGVLNFQCWFRDPAMGNQGFNTSDGFQVTFLP
jgi:probable HAF family extracellular repeat protein